jgi:hypothetical protein
MVVIVRKTDAGLLLITQPDHAALAGRILAAWTGDGLPSSTRRADILRAAFEHDNGWRQEDAQPRVSADGEVLDFITAPTAVRQGIWPSGVARLRTTPYAAALVAQHSISIFDRYRSDPAWSAHFAAMEGLRDECLAASGGVIDELLRDYFFVNVADTASLTFCNGWTDPSEIRPYRLRLEGQRLRIVPDPFGGRDVHLTVSARALSSARFDSDSDARIAFDSAPGTELTGVASGQA